MSARVEEPCFPTQLCLDMGWLGDLWKAGSCPSFSHLWYIGKLSFIHSHMDFLMLHKLYSFSVAALSMESTQRGLSFHLAAHRIALVWNYYHQCSVRLKGANGFKISREAWGDRGTRSCTPTYTLHKCTHLISSGNWAKNTENPRETSFVYLQAWAAIRAVHGTDQALSVGWWPRFSYMFSTSSWQSNNKGWNEQSFVPRPLLFCSHYVSNQFSLLCSCCRVGKVLSWWEIQGSLACTQSLFSPKR